MIKTMLRFNLMAMFLTFAYLNQSCATTKERYPLGEMSSKKVPLPEPKDPVMSIWRLPSHTGAFDKLDPQRIPSMVVAMTMLEVRAELISRGYKVLEPPFKLATYSVNGTFPCNGDTSYLGDFSCNGVTYLHSAPYYVEIWVNRDRGTSEYYCWSDTSLAHELVHMFIYGVEGDHETRDIWSGDPKSVVSVVNNRLRPVFCNEGE